MVSKLSADFRSVTTDLLGGLFQMPSILKTNGTAEAMIADVM